MYILLATLLYLDIYICLVVTVLHVQAHVFLCRYRTISKWPAVCCIPLAGVASCHRVL
jgi:hypothetical protein